MALLCLAGDPAGTETGSRVRGARAGARDRATGHRSLACGLICFGSSALERIAQRSARRERARHVLRSSSRAPERCRPRRKPGGRRRARRRISNDDRDRACRERSGRRPQSHSHHSLDAAVAPPAPRDHPRRGRTTLHDEADENQSARDPHRRASRRSSLAR